MRVRLVIRWSILWGGLGRSLGGWDKFLYMAQYGCACRMAPFFNAATYMIGHLFPTKSIWMDSYVKGPTFLTSWYMHIFFAQWFFEAACSLGIQWIDFDIRLTTSNKWVQQIKRQYMNRSTFRMIRYMIGSVFSKARYMNGVGFEILARTPVPQLPPIYHPTPPRVDHDTARSGNIPY